MQKLPISVSGYDDGTIVVMADGDAWCIELSCDGALELAKILTNMANSIKSKTMS